MIVYFHSRFINSPSLAPINVGHRVASTSKLEARNVRVVLDDQMSGHIICSSSSLAVRNIGRVRKSYLDQFN